MRFTEACLLKTENNMTTLSEPLVTPKYGKWRQLVLGLICMAAISSPQYVWTLLTKPLAAKLGVGLPELQVTFSLLIILQTFFSPFQGRLVEKFGPRRLIAIGTVMAGMSWVLSAQVNGLATLWLVYGCMGGLGTGIVYIGVVGLMVKWFPQQRGFAAGAVAAGYGMGAIITTFPISLSLTTMWGGDRLCMDGSSPRKQREALRYKACGRTSRICTAGRKMRFFYDLCDEFCTILDC